MKLFFFRKIVGPELLNVSIRRIRLNSHILLNKKTYGHKYYVAASISFEEKSYPFIRKMK